MPTIRVLHDDALAALRGMEDASIDAVVTDPPYGLSKTDPAHVAEALAKWVTGDHEYTPPVKGGGFAYCLPINPEPWAVGNAFVARNRGKAHAAIAPNKTLKSYQEAVRSELLARGAEVLDGPYALRLWFWRENVTYLDAGGRKRTRNSPDLTNLVKATEDALQGVLIDNDRDVVTTTAYIVARGKGVEPQLVIEVEQVSEDGWQDTLTPAALYAVEHEKAAADRLARQAAESNLWTPGT